ncbi:MAG: NAD/FAD-utilizing enzyme [Porticoccaceae bacterium]
MERYYFVHDDLDDLEAVEMELENCGVIRPQIHVLSLSDREVALHQLHEVHAFMKTDVVHWGLRGACFGVLAALLVLAFAYFGNLTAATGWVPFIFLAIVLLGFCTWEGGFFGIQVPNREFLRFQDALKEGKHILFVDLKPSQLPVLERVSGQHGKLKSAGKGAAAPSWVIAWQQKYRKFTEWAP